MIVTGGCLTGNIGGRDPESMAAGGVKQVAAQTGQFKRDLHRDLGKVALGNRWHFQTGGVSGRFDCIKYIREIATVKF